MTSLLPSTAPEPPAKQRFVSLDASIPIEEETMPYYNADDWYPVFIGEVFKSRYQVLRKLGYGQFSTVWFSRDLQSHVYVALKVYKVDNREASQLATQIVNGLHREIDAYQCMSAIKTSHRGQRFVRQMLDSFTVSSARNTHHCLVHPPLWDTIRGLQRINYGNRLPESPLRGTITYLLEALDYLHGECGLIHTDIKASNIMLDTPDKSILKSFGDGELDSPSSRKILDGRTIYRSRKFVFPKSTGFSVLCDFGEARRGIFNHNGLIQPEIYRAPEVILDMHWDYKVDIWMVGVMIWGLFENKHLFDASDLETGEYDPKHHLAEMVAYLGPPSQEFLGRSKSYGVCFDEHGNWTSEVPVPTHLGLESGEVNLEGENKEAFLRFLRSMLCWDPDERKTAKMLLEDPWLKGQGEFELDQDE